MNIFPKWMTNSNRGHVGLAVLCVGVLFIGAPTRPQSKEQAHEGNFSPELIQQLAQIKSAALADDYAYRQLKYLTENIGARPSGSPGAQAAADYVAAELRQLGLDVHLEQVKVPHWVRGTETASLIDYPGHVAGTQQKIVLTALGGSTSTRSEGLTANLLVVHDFDQLRALGREVVTGKIVLFNAKFDTQAAAAGAGYDAYRKVVQYRSDGPSAAAKLGAVAALVRSVGSGNYRLPHTGDSDPAGIPAAAVTSEDADLIAHLAAEGPVRMHLTLTPEKLPDVISYNVIADLKGSKFPDQVIIVSGHLDSWDLGTGALDDAAGVSVAMATAKLMEQLHLRPKRTIRVIAWMDEENNGSGSSQYSKDHAAEYPNHVAAIESDAGAAHPLGFGIHMSQAAAATLQPVQNILASIGASRLEQFPHPPGTTDLSLMSEAGVPALGIMQDTRTYYIYHHTAADTLDKVSPSELRENVAAMAVMAYALAERRENLPR